MTAPEGTRTRGSTPFEAATAAEPIGPGRYRGILDDSWTTHRVPLGGIVTALALRAMRDAIGDTDQRLRTLHTIFEGPVADGELVVDVTVLRRGRTLSQLRADVRNPGARSGHSTTAIFGASRPGFQFTDISPPQVPPPEKCPSSRDALSGDLAAPLPFWADPMPIWQTHVDQRFALGQSTAESWTAGPASHAVWFRFDSPPIDTGGVLDPLAVVALSDTLPGALFERVGPHTRQWIPLSMDLTVHCFADCRSEWVLSHNRTRYAGDGFASAELTMWDCGDDGRARPTLLTYSTQVMCFSFLPDEPT